MQSRCKLASVCCMMESYTVAIHGMELSYRAQWFAL